MAALFVSASTQSIAQPASAITLTLPFTVGMWVNPATSGTGRGHWSYGAANGWQLSMTSANAWAIDVVNGGTTTSGTTGATTVGLWTYIVGRFISINSRRLSIYQANGATSSAVETTSINPGLVSPVHSIGTGLGGTNGAAANGSVAEFFLANVDIQPDGAALLTQTIINLALNGPFSIPSIAQNIMDYRSLRNSMSSNQDGLPDYFYSPLGFQTWNASASAPVVTAHPPLSADYSQAGDNIVLRAM